ARPAGAERDAAELALLTRLLTPVGAVEGFGAARLRDAQQRALRLAQALGVEPEAPLLRSLAIASVVAGDFSAGRAHAERLRVRALHDGDDAALVESDYMLGIAAFWQGALPAARSQFESVVARYRDEQRTTHLLRYGPDPNVVCLNRPGNTLPYLGDAAAAG